MKQKQLYNKIEKSIAELYSKSSVSINFQNTRKDFNGDVTLVVFSLLNISKKNPEETAKDIGAHLVDHVKEVVDFNVVKGFLNLHLNKDLWFDSFIEIYDTLDYGIVRLDKDSPTYLVEYSSPNTNKPLHFGHLRNNFLGYSIAEILKASGKHVKKVQIINDRGIHIC